MSDFEYLLRVLLYSTIGGLVGFGIVREALRR